MARKIGISNEKGRIAIRFMREGQRYSLMGLGNWDSNSDRQKAEHLAWLIQTDILEGCFDASLERYRNGLAKTTKRLRTPIEMLALWVDSLDLSEQNYRIHYEPIIQATLHESCKGFESTHLADLWKHLASRTYNDRIGYLKRFGKWMVDEGYLPLNPYRGLKNKPNKTIPIQPFTQDEANRIVEFISSRNPMVGAYYRFLFLTGCRPSEALGLLKTKVNSPVGFLTIDSALVRDSSGAPGTRQRTMKGTKTGDTRILPMTTELSLCIVQALTYQQSASIESELVFCDHKGGALDDTNVNARYWKPTLKELKIPYRKPYTIRHTAGSMVIENGGTLADAAKLLGHADLRMVSTTYGHAIKPVQLPDYSTPGSNLKL
jgi:integrase